MLVFALDASNEGQSSADVGFDPSFKMKDLGT